MGAARLKIVVVTWDLTHNGAASAFVLADFLRRQHDVEIIGPTFFASEIWEPIRNAGIAIRSFPGSELPQFVEDAERFVDSIEADVVYGCKPRFPTLLLSMLIKDQCEAPVILHVDDLELGFVGATDPISLDELERRRGLPDFSDPIRGAWVSACDGLGRDADALTVSGEELKRRYGGTVLGQPCDERVFDPARVDRRAARAEFGYTEEDRLVLFVGTPHRHKGIVELASAVAELDDQRIKLCIIGSFNDVQLREEIARLDRRRIQLIDYRPISEVPRLVAIGDLVCLPQHATVGFSAYQTPMKLTEAMAMGVPVLARETPALAPFARSGLIETIDDGPLSARIAEVFANPGPLREMVRRSRDYFLAHLSYAVALETVNHLIASLERHQTEVPSSWKRAYELACSYHWTG
jgi:glycosyltransferase involved in cell wall biosynthesis